MGSDASLDASCFSPLLLFLTTLPYPKPKPHRHPNHTFTGPHRPIESTLLGEVSSPASRYNPSCTVGWPTLPGHTRWNVDEGSTQELDVAVNEWMCGSSGVAVFQFFSPPKFRFHRKERGLPVYPSEITLMVWMVYR